MTPLTCISMHRRARRVCHVGHPIRNRRVTTQVDHREGLLTPAQLEESWMQAQLSLSGLIQEHMTRLSRPGHFLQVGLGQRPLHAC